MAQLIVRNLEEDVVQALKERAVRQAATALVHGLTFVTRATGDLQGVEVPLLNPFEP